MTQTYRVVPGQRSTTVGRPGSVYAYRTRRFDRDGMPLDGTEIGYVGQTRQALVARDGQHRGTRAQRDGTVKCQPFADLIDGEIVLLESGLWTDADLDRREMFHIGALRPRFNYVGNAGPHRVPIYEARRHRDNRDRARGLEARVWPSRREAWAARPVRRFVVRRPSRRTVRRALPVGAFLALWLIGAIAGQGMDVAWRTWPILAAGLCALPLARKPRRKANRKAAFWAVVLATVALVILAN